MGLPRHLQGKFDPTNGTLIANAATGPAGASATSDPAAQPANRADGAEAIDAGTDQGTPAASLSTAASPTPAQQSVDAGAAASSQPVHANGDGGADDGAAGGEENFRRMEGRYKAEITRLKGLLERAEEASRGTGQITDFLAETRQELADARRKLAELQGGGEAASLAGSAHPELPELTDEEKAMYGDFAPVAEKLITRATAPLLQQIEDLKKASGTSGEALEKFNESLFVRDVKGRVPDMGTIAESPEWKEYLQRNIPLTRLRIQDALLSAHNERDLAGVVSIFDTFKAEQGKVHQQSAGDNAAANGAVANAAAASASASSSAPASGLAQFATPDRSAANGNLRPSATFKESDYRDRMDSMRSGRITKEQFLQFENEFNEAKRRGLVSKE